MFTQKINKIKPRDPPYLADVSIFSLTSSIWRYIGKYVISHKMTSPQRIFFKTSENVLLTYIKLCYKFEVILANNRNVMALSVFSNLIWNYIGKSVKINTTLDKKAIKFFIEVMGTPKLAKMCEIYKN